jgi:outer membrane receptor protein involved in Fe transport
MARKLWLYAGVASLIPAFPLLAQTAPEAEVAASDGLDDIIVTAQRRSQDLRDVPISITAANAEALATARVDNVANIQAISPSVSFRVTNIASSSANLVIRGLGTTGNSRSFEGSVGVFIDGVYRTRAAAALQNFLDIDNLEVLRGPQGTLFGKNTTAGALLLSSAAPSLNEAEGMLDVTVGNFNTVIARAAGNVPLNDKLAVRIAGVSSLQDGFFTDPTNGRTYNDTFNYALKGQLLFEASDTVSIRLIGDFSNTEGNCCYATANVVDGPTQPLINALTRANGRQLPSTRLSDFEQSLSIDGNQRIRDYGGTMLVDVAFGDDTLKSITAIRQFDVSQANMDADFSGADILILDETFSSRFLSQELVWNGRISSINADYTLGIFVSDERIDIGRTLDWGTQAQPYWNAILGAQGIPPGTVRAAAGLVADERMRGTARSYAGFGQTSIDVGGGFTLIGGLRYSIEEKTGSFAYNFYDPAPNAVFRVLGVSPGPDYDDRRTDRAFSGTVGIQYRPSDDVMLYGTYNRGFKAGGVNIDANGGGTVANNPAERPGAVPLDATFEPETVNAFELGAKTEYLDGRARTNLSLYYYDISNIQVAQFVGLQFTVLNGRRAVNYGVELENLFKVNDAITVSLDGIWIPEARIKEDAGIDPVLSDSRFRFAPEFQGNAAINLDTPITDNANLIGRLQYMYSGPQFVNTASLSRRDSVQLVNANLGVRLNSGVMAELWTQNLFNETFVSQLFATPLQTGDQNAYMAPPRTFGVRFRANF